MPSDLRTAFLARVEPRLADQLRFLIEADRLKSVMRGNRIADGSRRENTAEHSWHLALFAMTLAEWATGPIDVARVMQMLLLHDLVEIECGDTPIFGTHGMSDQAEREQVAADKIFGILPADQSARMRALWEEFEAASTHDARFAKALDRLQPILLNHLAGGGTWLDYDVDLERERRMTNMYADAATSLWSAVDEIYEDAVRLGWLRR